MIDLTVRQQKVLDFISNFAQTHGYSAPRLDISRHSVIY